MKKMIYGLAIAAMAVGVSAFTTIESYQNEKGGHLVDYIWFPVTGSEPDCDQATPDLTLYPVSMYENAEDVPTSADPAENCNGQFLCCAKGYSTTNVEKQVIGGEEYWVPESPNADTERKRNQ
ncbi:MAG: hypothetical protein FWJ85_08870 [Solitalea sp.]